MPRTIGLKHPSENGMPGWLSRLPNRTRFIVCDVMADVTYDPNAVGMRNWSRLTVEVIRARGVGTFAAWKGCGRKSLRQITEAIGGWE